MRFLASPAIRAIVGQNKQVIDFKRCMDEREIVLVNLAPSDRFSAEHGKLMGTLLINDICLKAFVRSKIEQPFYVYVDECYRFLNDDIETFLDQTRKFGVHVNLAHQRLGQLEEKNNAVMTGAQTKVVFGGLTASDAKEMAENIFIGEFDLEKVKHTFDKPTVVGHVPEWLRSQAETISNNKTWSEGESAGVSVPDDDPEKAVRSDTTSSSRGGGNSRSSSRGRHETLRPVLENLPTQGHTLEELREQAAATLVNQPPRSAVVKMPGQKSCKIRVSDVKDAFASPEDIRAFTNKVLKASDFASPRQAIEKEMSDRREKLQWSAVESLYVPETEEGYLVE